MSAALKLENTNGWDVVYEKAIREDGTLFFPQKLTLEFLEGAKRTMGSYVFANQYMNEVIPQDQKKFKKEWLQYHDELDIPDKVYNFGFIDPAIGQTKRSDYTAISVISVDVTGKWWVRVAKRYRLTPTEILNKFFELCQVFQLKQLGVESQVFQEALVHFGGEEMKRRKKTIPLVGIKRGPDDHKNTRILSLVPRFEYGMVSLPRGLTDFESEYDMFPRASHDDILDSLQSIEEIVFYPQSEKAKNEKPHSPHDPNYEKWFRENAHKRASRDEHNE